MDIKRLEEEFNALLSDKAGETEYLKTLQDQIVKLKVNCLSGFSLVFKDVQGCYLVLWSSGIPLHLQVRDLRFDYR